MLIVVRHGPTDYNVPGEKSERIRGYLDIPLSTAGEAVAEESGRMVADILDSHPDYPPLADIYSSDLSRAFQTACAVRDAIDGPEVIEDPDFRPWNLGSLAGQLISDVQPKIDKLVDNPDTKAPGGESINDFLNRFDDKLRGLVEQDEVTNILATHARNCSAIEYFSRDAENNHDDVADEFLKSPTSVDPGGIMIVRSNWTYDIINPQEKPKKQPMNSAGAIKGLTQASRTS